jgi:hypothetical protein
VNTTDDQKAEFRIIMIGIAVYTYLVAVGVCVIMASVYNSTAQSAPQTAPVAPLDSSLFFPTPSQLVPETPFDWLLSPSVPAEPPSILSAFPFTQSVIDKRADDYNHLLGTPGADWVVGDVIAHRGTSGYRLPVGDMTGWPSTVEVVYGRTPAEYARSDRSAHGYSTCDIQQGGQTLYIGLVPDTLGLVLMQYVAPTDTTVDRGTYCTGGEYFFPTPAQVTKMAFTPFS